MTDTCPLPFSYILGAKHPHSQNERIAPHVFYIRFIFPVVVFSLVRFFQGFFDVENCASSTKRKKEGSPLSPLNETLRKSF